MRYVIFSFLYIVHSGFCNIVPTLRSSVGSEGVEWGRTGLGDHERRADNRARVFMFL